MNILVNWFWFIILRAKLHSFIIQLFVHFNLDKFRPAKVRPDQSKVGPSFIGAIEVEGIKIS